MVEKTVRGLVEAGESLLELRDIKYWMGKITPKYSKAKKRAKAIAWMRTMGTVAVSEILERILTESGKYDRISVRDFVNWAKNYTRSNSTEFITGNHFF